MPAALETGVFANTPAWHQLGTVLDTDGELGIRVEQALVESGLDWEVEKCPIFAYRPEDLVKEKGIIRPKRDAQAIRVERRYGVQRNTDHTVLGVVGKTWEPYQNVDGFQGVDDVLDLSAEQMDQPVYIESAGSLDGGRKVFVLAHVPDVLRIAGEPVTQYMLFTNGHDGRTSITVAMTNVRVVCQNTLAWALQEAPRFVKVRHTKKAAERIKEARNVLGLRDLYADALAQQGEWLVEQSMSDAEFDKFLEQLMPIPDDQEGKPADTMIRKRRDEVRAVYFNDVTQKDVRGTKWGALQAVVEYRDHVRDFKSLDTAFRAQTENDVMKQAAVELLTV